MEDEEENNSSEAQHSGDEYDTVDDIVQDIEDALDNDPLDDFAVYQPGQSIHTLRREVESEYSASSSASSQATPPSPRITRQQRRQRQQHGG